MHDATDMDLLRQYADGHSDAAFAVLVSRHVDLVYSAALRKTGNPNAAEDITQVVFIILAQKAGRILDKTILPGWLYQTARLTASSFLRRETRRVRREQEAYMQTEPYTVAPDETWEQLAPLLEDAMGQLGDKDRAAVVLRFFGGKSFAEVAAAASVSENAAKKRVGHALEKLRRYFAKHGVSSTTVIIAGAISTHSVQAAPVALAKSVTAVAVAKGAAASGSTLTLIKGALKIMAWTKMKTAIVGSAVVLLAAGTATVTVKEIESRRPQVWQEKYDPSVLDRLPPQVKIRPSLPSTVQSNMHVEGEHNGKALGLGFSVSELFLAAYGIHSTQLILNAPIPEGKYDFIANLPNGNAEAGREEIKKTFGLTGRREMIETNVLILTVQSRKAAGLRRPAGQISSELKPDSYSAHNQSIYGLVEYVQHALEIMVVDQTGLTGNFDIDLKWDATPEGLKQVLLDQLGLKLTPSRQTVEFIVVEKVK